MNQELERNIENKKSLCESCEHFYKHYVKTSKGFKETCFGHCCIKRKKLQRFVSECKKFQKSEEKNIEFSKQYFENLVLKIHKQLKEVLEAIENKEDKN